MGLSGPRAGAGTGPRGWPVAAMVVLGVAWLLNVVLPPDNGRITDVPIYFAAGDAMRLGAVPYADFDLEYPPLAAALFAVPALVAGGDFARYEDLLAALLLGFGWAGQVAAHRIAGERSAGVVAWGIAAAPVVFGTLVRERFDLAPVALLLLALLALLRDRTLLAAALIAAGALLKLFPLVLAGPGIAWLVARGRGWEARRATLLGLAILAAVCVPLAVASPSGFAGQVTFHLERPVQIESAPAGVLRVLGGSQVTGVVGNEDRYRSQGLEGGAADVVAALFALLQVLALALAVLLTWRATRRAAGDRDAEARALVLGAMAAVLAFVALGKVLSPQFLLWLWPFALLAWVFGERAVALLSGAATALTAAYFPRHYFDMVGGDDAAVICVGVRNAVLIAALSLLLARLAGPARSTPPAWGGPPSR